MSRCNTIIAAALAAAALAAAALAAPTALAQPRRHPRAGSAEAASGGAEQAGPALARHARRRPLRRRRPTATPRVPETAGSPNISAGVDHPAQASDDDKHATTDGNVTAAADRALAQERYYDVVRREHATTDDNVTPAADSRAGPGAALRCPTASPRLRPSRRGPWRPTPATGSPDYLSERRLRRPDPRARRRQRAASPACPPPLPHSAGDRKASLNRDPRARFGGPSACPPAATRHRRPHRPPFDAKQQPRPVNGPAPSPRCTCGRQPRSARCSHQHATRYRDAGMSHHWRATPSPGSERLAGRVPDDAMDDQRAQGHADPLAIASASMQHSARPVEAALSRSLPSIVRTVLDAGMAHPKPPSG